MISCYGMPVGQETFMTVLWIGAFFAIAEDVGLTAKLVYRRDIKLHLCNSTRAKDTNIRQSLIDRYGKPGTKKNPGKTYGFKKDMWSALAVGTCYIEKYI